MKTIKQKLIESRCKWEERKGSVYKMQSLYEDIGKELFWKLTKKQRINIAEFAPPRGWKYPGEEVLNMIRKEESEEF